MIMCGKADPFVGGGLDCPRVGFFAVGVVEDPDCVVPLINFFKAALFSESDTLVADADALSPEEAPFVLAAEMFSAFFEPSTCTRLFSSDIGFAPSVDATCATFFIGFGFGFTSSSSNKTLGFSAALSSCCRSCFFKLSKAVGFPTDTALRFERGMEG
jgi:hypothetical protein